MTPTTRPPRGGTRITQGPRCCVVGPSISRDSVPRKQRLVTSAMSRWSPCATPAARIATPTARAHTQTVRLVTFAACGAMWADASPGAIEGATGRPSVVDPLLEGFSATASGPGPGGCLAAASMGTGFALEEHGRGCLLVDAHSANHALQQQLELSALATAQVLQR